MKNIFLTVVFMVSVFMGYAQISLNRTDFYSAGDRIPFVKYYAPANQTFSFNALFEEDPIFDDLDWTPKEIDSIWFLLPAMLDFEGVFNDANCAYSTDGMFFRHIDINENSVRQLGTQMFNVQGSGMDISMRFDQALMLYEFPIEYQNVSTGSATAGYTLPLSDFEEFIEMIMDYETIATFFDSVKFQVTVYHHSEFEEHGTMQFIGASNLNGTFPYLREKNTTITSFDLLLRNIFTGSYMSIGDIPMLPLPPEIEFPLVDSVNVYNYWTNSHKYPLAEINMDSEFSNVLSVSHRYCDKSSVDIKKMALFKVFPNPAGEVIYFAFNNTIKGKIRIYNISGEQTDIIYINDKIIEYDLTGLANGNYIFHIIDDLGTNISAGKFVISR